MKDICTGRMDRHVRKLNLIYWLLAFLSVMAIGRAGFAIERTFAYHIDTPSNAWHEIDLGGRLKQILSRQPNLKVIDGGTPVEGMPAFPEDIYTTDSLNNWGLEVGAKYVLAVDVESIRLERRKGFHLPLIFHKYETVGVIEAEIRLIETSRGRLVLAERIKVQHQGPRAFQATMDDNIDDPDLHITASDKIVFFGQLEEKFCNKLTEKIGKKVHLRKF